MANPEINQELVDAALFVATDYVESGKTLLEQVERYQEVIGHLAIAIESHEEGPTNESADTLDLTTVDMYAALRVINSEFGGDTTAAGREMMRDWVRANAHTMNNRQIFAMRTLYFEPDESMYTPLFSDDEVLQESLAQKRRGVNHQGAPRRYASVPMIVDRVGKHIRGLPEGSQLYFTTRQFQDWIGHRESSSAYPVSHVLKELEASGLLGGSDEKGYQLDISGKREHLFHFSRT